MLAEFGQFSHLQILQWKEFFVRTSTREELLKKLDKNQADERLLPNLFFDFSIAENIDTSFYKKHNPAGRGLRPNTEMNDKFKSLIASDIDRALCSTKRSTTEALINHPPLYFGNFRISPFSYPA